MLELSKKSTQREIQDSSICSKCDIEKTNDNYFKLENLNVVNKLNVKSVIPRFVQNVKLKRLLRIIFLIINLMTHIKEC